MAVALARARADAAPARAATPEATPVVHRVSSDSRRYALSGHGIQPALRISAAHDPAEREAESVAARVARGGISQHAGDLQRSPLLVQRRSPGPGAAGGTASPLIESRVRAAATGGSALVPALRQTVEPRFRADFGGVRLHTDAKAAALATAIGARAFTFGNHIFFNDGQYQPHTPEGLELLAHELTHTIQQSAVIQRAVDDAPAISERTAPEASRLGISDALDFFADAANAIPGFRMFTILIGVNPINMNAVEASAANILRAIVEFLPGGFVITRVLDSYGIFDRVGGWIEGQLKSLGITGAAIRAAVNAFLDSLSWRDIFALGSLWDRAKSIFTTPITRIIAFARSLFTEILRFVREAVLRPLAALAEGTAGYGLLKAVIGFDPVTGEAVPRTADTLIGGFMTMIGQQELWENIKRSNATSRAWAWFQGALGGLMGLVRSIPDRFMTALRGLEIMDFVVLPSAFLKLARVFGNFLGDFASWAGGTIFNLLEIIVEVVAPAAIPYLKRAAGAFRTIIQNPVGFVGNLVRAAVQGFRQFASRFLTHLQASMIGWLTGALGGTGVYIPRSLGLMELVKFVLSVMGLTWANIRGKLVRATNETVVNALETGFDIVRTLVTEGPAAAWQKIVETLTNLKQMAIDAVMDFVKSKVVEAAVTKLLSMLNPAGAFIQALIAIYNTIMFFVERIRQIAQVAASFIDSIASIAAGNIASAANRVEQTMAGLLTLVISFLARIAGLGKVSDAVLGLIKKIRDPIDKALDKVVAWIVTMAKRLGKMVAKGAKSLLNWWKEKRRPVLGDGATHTLSFDGSEKLARLMLASKKSPLEQHLADAIDDSTLSKAARARASKALQFYTKNIEPISGKPIPDTPTPAVITLLDSLPSNMNALTDLLIAIADKDIDMPAAVPAFNGPGRAAIEKLSNRSSRGGQDARSGMPKGWDLIVKRGLTSRNGNWVRMHMISAGFGGADSANNLVPTPTAVNTGGSVRGFEKAVERIFYGEDSSANVRAAASLWKRLQAKRTVLWVETTTGGFWSASTELDPLTNKPIHDDSTYVTSVALSAGIYFPKDGVWTKDTRVMAQGGASVPKPDFSGTYIPSISGSGRPLIAKLAGIGEHFAREIVDRGPHSSLTNFVKNMKTGRHGENITVTPELNAAMAAVIAAVAAKKLKWKD